MSHWNFTAMTDRPFRLCALAVALSAGNCMGIAGFMKDNSENSEQAWLAALLNRTGGGSPPTQIAAAPPSLSVPDALNFPADALQVKESTTIDVPMRINGSFVPAGKIYNVGPEDPMSEYEYSLVFPDGQVELKYKYDEAELKDAGLTREFAVYSYDKLADEWVAVDRVQTDTSKNSVSAFTSHMTPFVITAVPASNGNLADVPSCITSDYPAGIGGSAGAQLTTLDGGFRYLKDRNYYIVPDQNFQDLGFSQALGVATCNGDSSCGTFDQHKLNEGADYVVFNAHANIDVYLMYDTRGGSNLSDTSKDAPWIASTGFANTGRFITTTDPLGRFRVYKKAYAKGQQVRLDGNRNGVTSKAIQSNYWLVIKRQGVTSAETTGSICEAVNRPLGTLTVSNLKAVPGSDRVTLSWQNPDDPEYGGFLIRRSAIAPPSLPTDGVALSGSTLSAQSFRDEGVNTKTIYYYTVFAYDQSNNFQTGVSVVVKTGTDTDSDGVSDAYEAATIYPTTQPSQGSNADTDGDGTPDGDEIGNGTDPTNPDSSKPNITFTLTSQSTTNDPVVRYALDGTDDTGITGWMVTRSAAVPLASASGWSATKPAYTTLSKSGVFDLYAWARDAAGNVNAAMPKVSVNLEGINVPKWLYVSYGPQLRTFSMDPVTGALNPIQDLGLSYGGGYPQCGHQLAIDYRQNSLYLAKSDTCYTGESVPFFQRTGMLEVFRIDPVTGQIGSIQSTPLTVGAPRLLALNPDRNLLHTTFLGAKSIDPATGLVAASAEQFLWGNLSLGSGGNIAYTSGGSFRVEAAGTLTLLQSLPGGTPAGIFGHPSKAFQYGLSGDGSSIFVYAVDPLNGALSAIGPASAGCNYAYELSFSPDGRFLYGACQYDQTISILAIDGVGSPRSVGSTGTGGGRPTAITVTRRNAYVNDAAPNAHRIIVFERDETSGALTYLQSADLPGFSSPFPVESYSAVYEQHDGNDPPVANAGAERWHQFTSGTIALQGHSSFDPDAVRCNANTASYAYAWSFVSVPGGSAITNANITNAGSLTSASFNPDVTGDYVLRLTFTDDPGTCQGTAKTASSTVKIKVGYYHTQNEDYLDTVGAAPVSGAAWNETQTPAEDWGVDFQWSMFRFDSMLGFDTCHTGVVAVRDACLLQANYVNLIPPWGPIAANYMRINCLRGYAVAFLACRHTFLNRYNWLNSCTSPGLTERSVAIDYCASRPAIGEIPTSVVASNVELWRAHFFEAMQRHYRHIGYWSWWTYN